MFVLVLVFTHACNELCCKSKSNTSQTLEDMYYFFDSYSKIAFDPTLSISSLDISIE